MAFVQSRVVTHDWLFAQEREKRNGWGYIFPSRIFFATNTVPPWKLAKRQSVHSADSIQWTPLSLLLLVQMGQCGHRNMAQQGEKKAVKDDRHPHSPFPRPSNPSLHPNDGVNVMANEKKKNETVAFEDKESGLFSAFANARWPNVCVSRSNHCNSSVYQHVPKFHPHGFQLSSTGVVAWRDHLEV